MRSKIVRCKQHRWPRPSRHLAGRACTRPCRSPVTVLCGRNHCSACSKSAEVIRRHLHLRRSSSIEDPEGILNSVALSPERGIAQLQESLDRMLARFRSWLPSRDDLEDCRASVLSRVWNRPIVGQLIDEARFSELNDWLFQCIRNELRNRHRARTREAALRSRAVFASPPPVSPYESIDFNVQLQQTIDNLPPNQARLIHLAYVDGLSPEEIAVRENRSLVAVRRALSRARKAFRDRWDSEKT